MIENENTTTEEVKMNFETDPASVVKESTVLPNSQVFEEAKKTTQESINSEKTNTESCCEKNEQCCALSKEQKSLLIWGSVALAGILLLRCMSEERW